MCVCVCTRIFFKCVLFVYLHFLYTNQILFKLRKTHLSNEDSEPCYDNLDFPVDLCRCDRILVPEQGRERHCASLAHCKSYYSNPNLRCSEQKRNRGRRVGLRSAL